ncbi:hypothetical protein MY3296_009010 [Beauveria thailandica]
MEFRSSLVADRRVIVLRTTSCDEGGAYLTTKARILERAGAGAGFLIALSNTAPRHFARKDVAIPADSHGGGDDGPRG